MIRMRVTEGGESRLLEVRTDSIRFGRSADCDVTLEDSGVSREHAEFAREQGAWVLRDLGSRNGTFVDDAPATHQRLRVGNRVRLGPDVVVEILADEPEDDADFDSVLHAAPITRPAHPSTPFAPWGWMLRRDWVLEPRASHSRAFAIHSSATTVGRDPDAGLVLDDESVSRMHGRLDREGAMLAVVDLKSSNGTYVNDDPVTVRELSHGDLVRFGDVEFQVIRRGGLAWNRLALIAVAIVALVLGSTGVARLSDWWNDRAIVKYSAEQLSAQAIDDTRAGIEAARGGDAEMARAYLLHAADLLLVSDLAPAGASMDHPAEIFREVIPHLNAGQREFDFAHALDPATVEGSQARLATLTNRDYVEYQLRRYAVELGQDPHVPRGFIEQVQAFVASYERSPGTMRALLRRSRDLQPRIRTIFASRHLPESFCYVAWVESALLPTQRSPVGALGLWQFMPATAQQYHLRVAPANQPERDDRTNIELSTAAAADYIASLLRDQGPEYFMLVLASYNRGPGAVSKAKQRVADPMLPAAHKYWYLVEHELLPKETRDYVPKILATRLIAEAPERFNVEVP